MSARLPGPGPQLSTGHIRVDAGRAIAKLREYQLADRTHWVLEAIRAAVASGAKSISLTGDANDIWLMWECAPWDVDVLPRLFDELVSPSAGSETQHIRLLAAAVNSALGMDPSYIDVFCVAETATHVARYRPEILVEPAEDFEESRLAKIAVERAKRPERSPIGMAVHLRRRVTLDLIAHFLTRPPEIPAAEQACRDIAVPLQLPDCEMHRSTTPDLVRIPLGEGVDGFIAVTEHATAEPQLVVAEHGVVLARYPLDLGDELEGRSSRHVPIRVFVDAPRMPTNASRSQVRRDKHPISTAEKAAKALLPTVIGKLAELVKSGDARARTAALAWIGGRAGGAQWHVEMASIHGPLRELAKLPLVRNAVGEPRGLAQHWRAEIHTGKAALPSELTAWMPDVIWMPPDDPARALLQGARIDERATRRFVRWAKRQAAAQRTFYSHTKRDAKVVASRKPRIRARLGADVAGSCIDQQRFSDLTGELCIYPLRDRPEPAGGSLVILLEGRELERVSIRCPIPFEAVVDSAHVKPADRYRGVERDSVYNRIERAVISGVIRAIEALSMDVQPAGYELENDEHDSDALLVRRALQLVRDQKQKLRGPLLRAPCWRTVDGRKVSVADLAAPVIGTVSWETVLSPPKGRLIVEAEEQQLLSEVTSARIVNYDRAHGYVGGEPNKLAERLARELGNGRPCALAIVDGDLLGAIAPASKSTVQLRHVGVKLETSARKARYVQSAVVVSSDEIVPDTDWKSAYRDHGLLGRDYSSWELALLRAMARAVAGELRPELHVPGVLSIDGPMGMALCEALVAGDPGSLLGDDDIIGPLCRAKIVKLLGERERISIEELQRRYPEASHAIPLVVDDAQLVRGFAPVHAPQIVGEAIAKLAGRKCYDARGELARRQKREQFDLRLAEHCARPEDRAPLPAPHVDVIGSYARGQVGVGATASWVRVFVENRMFCELHVPHALPVVANIDIAAEHCGETFEQIPDTIKSRILDDVLRPVPRLLVAIGKQTPEALASLGATRRLLAWAAPDLGDEARMQLCELEAFKTIQGTRISLETAWQPHHMLRSAAWQDDWLAPDKHEPQTTLDEPILAIATEDAELRTLVENLAKKPLADVTEDVVRLQAGRRMARGLIPTPKVIGVPPELKRSLSELGDGGSRLGHGELALIDADQSVIHLHSQGRFVRTIPFNVIPPVALAIEDHEVGKPEQLRDIQKLVDEFLGEHPLTHAVRTIAVDLVKQVLATPARSLLTPRMLRNLARAVWAHKLHAPTLGELAAFETIDHAWVSWSKVEEQVALFEDVWAVTEWTDERPLDDRRVVLLATKEDIEHTKQHRVKLVDAREELRLDGLARRNRAKPLASSLALPTRLGLLAEAELLGDGVKGPRGNVAVLIPSIAGGRGVTVYRGMQPLGTMSDPCVWPTIAVVDDARLEPDRIWGAPKPDQAWQAVAKTIRTASEKLLDTFGEAPAEALVSLRVDADVSNDIKALRVSGKSQVRGLVWLGGVPLEPNAVQLTHELGVTTVRDVPISGQLLLHAEGATDKQASLAQIASHMHGKLVRQLIATLQPDDPIVQAHVAHALALGNVKPTETRSVTIPCFAPSPLEPRTFVGLLRKQHPVDLIDPGQPSVNEVSVIDDGSPVSKIVILHLGKRLRRRAAFVAPSPAPPRPVTIEPPPPPRVEPKRAPAPSPKPTPKPEPEPPHPIQSLVELVSKRVSQLGLRGYEFRIVEQKTPMFQFAHGYLFVGGNNEKLRTLAVQVGASSAWLPAAIDALAAHVVSVLNIALTDVTDATEIDALQQLLTNPQSASPLRSHRSS